MILVDFHVHLYRCFSLPDLFTSAADNFQFAADRKGEKTFAGVLCLAESTGYDVFRQLQEGRKIGGKWACRPTADNQSLHLQAGDREIYLIAGRQVNTRERVEVLALGTAHTIADGQSLAATLEQVEHSGALPVLPWGVGKWLGTRGQLVEKILLDPERTVFPGDNGGRPYGWPEPGQFSLPGRRNKVVLPGSDPLPLSEEQNRAGSYGAVLEEIINDTPVRQIMKAVHAASSLQSYGRRISPFTFFIRQLQLRGTGEK